METKKLRKNIDLAIKNLLPLFKVTEKELKKFRKYSLTHGCPYSLFTLFFQGDTPCYSIKENEFYFPKEDNPYWTSAYSIHHEAGHYVHRFVNKNYKNWILDFEKTCKLPAGVRKLTELVADYGPRILNFKDEGIMCYQIFSEIYKRNGPEILPKLARMDLKEFVKSGIVKREEILELDRLC